MYKDCKTNKQTNILSVMLHYSRAQTGGNKRRGTVFMRTTTAPCFIPHSKHMVRESCD